MNIIASAIASVTIFSVSFFNNNFLPCEIVELDEYGFVQESEYTEFVCVNPNDYTDFVIVEDKKDSMQVGDKIIAKLF